MKCQELEVFLIRFLLTFTAYFTLYFGFAAFTLLLSLKYYICNIQYRTHIESVYDLTTKILYVAAFNFVMFTVYCICFMVVVFYMC